MNNDNNGIRGGERWRNKIKTSHSTVQIMNELKYLKSELPHGTQFLSGLFKKEKYNQTKIIILTFICLKRTKKYIFYFFSINEKNEKLF